MKHVNDTKSCWETITNRYPNIIQIVLLTLAVVCTYANSLTVPFIMDDEAIFSISLKSLSDIAINGGARRVADFTFAINHLIHGEQVAGYHLFNLTVHLCATLTLYFFSSASIAALRHSFPSATEAEETNKFFKLFVPFSAALLFAVHPVQTQAVTYIIQRYTSMATLFYLLTGLLYINARIAFESSRSPLQVLSLVVSAVFSGVMAIGSKQVAYTLPLMLVVLEILLFRGRLLNRKFFIIGGMLSITFLALAALGWTETTLKDILFDLRLGTMENRYTSRTTYFLTQSRVVITYLSLLFLPVNQSIFYDYPLYSSLFSLPVVASLFVHILIMALAIFLYRKSGQNLLEGNHCKGTLQRLASFGIAWFYITLLVESSFIPITDIIFEHRIYLPSAGFFLTISAGLAIVTGEYHSGRKTAWLLIVVASLFLGGATIARNFLWSDALKLWQDTVDKAPNQHLALSNLAIEYLEHNQPESAIPLFVKAIELRPQLDFNIKVYLGEALQKTGQIDGARFTTGIEYLLPGGRTSSYKSASVLFNNMGLAYEYLGSPHNALTSYSKALRVNPAYDLAWYNLALLSSRLGKQGQAVNALKQLEGLNQTLAASLKSKIQ